MAPELEAQIAPLLAQAALQVKQQNEIKAQAEAAQQNAQDPVVQQQMMDLQLREKELQAKVQLEMAKLQSQEKIAVMDNATKLQIQGAKEQHDGFTTGFGAVKDFVMKQHDQTHQANQTTQSAQHTQTAQERKLQHDAQSQQAALQAQREQAQARQQQVKPPSRG
jgi:hypothetical protein